MSSKTHPFEQHFRVLWSDLDGNAHMGNTSYLAYAVNTRMLYFAEHDFTLARFALEKFGPVVIREELTYRKELRLMDRFAVDYELVGISENGRSFKVRNTFRNANLDVAATVTSEGVWFDLEHRKPRIPPPDLASLMRALHHASDFG